MKRKGLSILLSVLLVMVLVVSFSVPVEAATTSIGSDVYEVNVKGSPVFCSNDVSSVYLSDIYKVQYNHNDGYFAVPVTFSYRLPIQTWNGSTYSLPSGSDTLRVYLPFKVTPSVSVSASSYSGSVSYLSVTGAALSCFGDSRDVVLTSNASGTVSCYADVFYKPGLRSVNNSSMVLTVNALLSGVVYGKSSSTVSDHITFNPSIKCVFGSAGNYTVRFYDYASGDVTVSDIQNQTDSINNNITKQTQQQTNTLTGGYDNSGMEDSNTALSGSMNDYHEKESQVTDQATSFIDGVEFIDLSAQAQLLTGITFASSFLQSLFVSLGDWGILVIFSLSVTLAFMLVGWFKFRR